MDTFTVRDLRERTGELIRDAEAGELAVITKHGRPVFVAVPFDEALIQEGVKVALAVKLFDEEVVSMGLAAKLAEMTLAEFMEECAARDVPVVRYEPKEVEQEVKVFDELHRR